MCESNGCYGICVYCLLVAPLRIFCFWTEFVFCSLWFKVLFQGPNFWKRLSNINDTLTRVACVRRCSVILCYYNFSAVAISIEFLISYKICLLERTYFNEEFSLRDRFNYKKIWIESILQRVQSDQVNRNFVWINEHSCIFDDGFGILRAKKWYILFSYWVKHIARIS